jgi:hypothetical protein
VIQFPRIFTFNQIVSFNPLSNPLSNVLI